MQDINTMIQNEIKSEAEATRKAYVEYQALIAARQKQSNGSDFSFIEVGWQIFCALLIPALIVAMIFRLLAGW